jgi:predicted RNA-binding protein with EMAP domain
MNSQWSTKKSLAQLTRAVQSKLQILKYSFILDKAVSVSIVHRMQSIHEAYSTRDDYSDSNYNLHELACYNSRLYFNARQKYGKNMTGEFKDDNCIKDYLLLNTIPFKISNMIIKEKKA